MRVTGRSAFGDPFDLEVRDGCWAEPSSPPSEEGRRLRLDWCLPGLADAHAHLSQDQLAFDRPADPEAVRRRAFACLGEGVFLCLDKGWRDEVVLRLLEEPPDRRPDLEAAGRILAAPGGFFPGFAEEVGEDELAAAVARRAGGPGGWVKVIGDWPRKGIGPVANFPEEALAGAVAVAHAAGARVAVHTMAPGVASAAVRAGVDSIEHGLFLTGEDLAILGRRAGSWVPTLWRMELTVDQLGAGSSGGRLIGDGLDNVRSLLPGAPGLGVQVLAGSDLAFPSSAIGREAVKLADYGLDPGEAVAAASVAARRATGRSAGFVAGEPADLVAFDRSPLEDVSALLEPVLVLRGGRVLADRR